MFAPGLLGGLLFSKNGLGAGNVTARGTRSVLVLPSCCVAFCMRRPKWAFCSDLISASEAGHVLLAQFSSFGHVFS